MEFLFYCCCNCSYCFCCFAAATADDDDDRRFVLSCPFDHTIYNALISGLFICFVCSGFCSFFVCLFVVVVLVWFGFGFGFGLFLLLVLKVLILAVLLVYCAGNPYNKTQHQHVDLGRVLVEAETFGKNEIGMSEFLL